MHAERNKHYSREQVPLNKHMLRGGEGIHVFDLKLTFAICMNTSLCDEWKGLRSYFKPEEQKSIAFIINVVLKPRQHPAELAIRAINQRIKLYTLSCVCSFVSFIYPRAQALKIKITTIYTNSIILRFSFL